MNSADTKKATTFVSVPEYEWNVEVLDQTIGQCGLCYLRRVFLATEFSALIRPCFFIVEL